MSKIMRVMKKFPIGTKVRSYLHPRDEYRTKGTVVDIYHDGSVMVEWEDGIRQRLFPNSPKWRRLQFRKR